MYLSSLVPPLHVSACADPLALSPHCQRASERLRLRQLSATVPFSSLHSSQAKGESNRRIHTASIGATTRRNDDSPAIAARTLRTLALALLPILSFPFILAALFAQSCFARSNSARAPHSRPPLHYCFICSLLLTAAAHAHQRRRPAAAILGLFARRTRIQNCGGSSDEHRRRRKCVHFGPLRHSFSPALLRFFFFAFVQ